VGVSSDQVKFGNTHLVYTFQFQQSGNKGPPPLTSGGQIGSPALGPSAFGLTWNGEDQSTGTIIKRTGDGAWMTLPQTAGEPEQQKNATAEGKYSELISRRNCTNQRTTPAQSVGSNQ